MPRKKAHWSDFLKKHNACKAAQRFARRQPSLQVAWDKCPDDVWLLWLLELCKRDATKKFTEMEKTRIKFWEEFWCVHRSGTPERVRIKADREAAAIVRQFYRQAPRISKSLLKA